MPNRKPKITGGDQLVLMEAAQERGPTATAEEVRQQMIQLGGRELSASAVSKQLATWRREGKLPPSQAREWQSFHTRNRLRQEETSSKPLTDVDGPWTSGVSGEYGIPLAATFDLLHVWAECVVERRLLTIRQAKWIVRLREILSNKRNQAVYGGLWVLYQWASIYAARERAAAALFPGQVADTRDLDAQLAFDGEVYQAAVETGAVPAWSMEKRRRETMAAVYPFTIYLEERGVEIDKRGEESYAPLFNLPSVERHTALKVYSLWSNAFYRKGAQSWGMSSRSDALDRLVQEIVAHFEALQTSTEPGTVEAPLTAAAPSPQTWRPSEELLKEVGYEE